jgi:hypothetical protein
MTQVLGFNFYGAGNVGDDFMLAGYLAGQPKSQKILASAIGAASQRQRFPQIEWYDSGSAEWLRVKRKELSLGTPWVGVGDTPFQITSGVWFANYLEAEAELLSGFSASPMIMIGVGAEEEVLRAPSLFKRSVERLDFVWCRDERSAQIIVDLGLSPTKIEVASDLAHISLSRIARPKASSIYDVGINYFAEKCKASDVRAFRDFLKQAQNFQIAFIASDARAGMEESIAARIGSGGPLQGLPRWFRPGVIQPTLELLKPIYGTATLAELAEPFGKCKVLLTSRYHGTLAAAWAGTKVGVLAGRSSKIAQLATELRLPMCNSPYNAGGLALLREKAAAPSRELLAELRVRAASSVLQLSRTVNCPSA